MGYYKKEFSEELKYLICNDCHKVMYIDLSDDSYDVLYVGDYEWNRKAEGQISGKISEWFEWFVNSPLCHENDRDNFKSFTDLNNLKKMFEESNYQRARIIYRRKFDLTDHLFSTVSMELIPKKTEEGHIVAFLTVKNITAEIKEYSSFISESESTNDNSGKRTILVVEDNELNLEIISEILSEEYEVLQAQNGAIGLEVLQKHMTDVSVVILDVQMPVMNGYEFLEKVQSDPFLSKIPVVVATGSDSVEEERRCLKLGASDFVAKPYNPEIIMSRISNIIRLKESVATMSALQTDEMTGLYTLQAFYYYAKQKIDQFPKKSFSIIAIDTNHFKTIYDVYGEQTGMNVLQQISNVLKEYTAASEIDERFGVARFYLLCETMSHEKTDEWINGLFETLKVSCGIKGISFNAGIYDNIDRALNVHTLCDRVVAALNSINKNIENKYVYYDESYAEKEHRLAIMETEMHDAYEKEQFSVFYQPKHDAKTGEIVGAEALIRWIHPTFGFLSPGEFIPLFERNGFVSYADFYVFKRTCKNIKKWLNEGIKMVPISVNASRRDFEYEGCLDVALNTIKSNGIDLSYIHVEVTESLFSDKIEEMSSVLQNCREAGLKIELDDFGAGYSSLTTLASLPLDVMKLDMSFMRNYKDEKKLKVLSTCIGLAKSLGLKTVSEGVENEEQLELLKKLGCDYIQGYYFSKPLPENEFKEYLKKYSK